ncbi:hypothetical protein [Spirillospora sp. CA-294931]|uniref:hypothetical protein n=1 Tax=Spirillospora sp. CA-294931 TaxID=3240042 RepID=UPI003D9191FE
MTDWDEPALARLRAAAYRRDGAAGLDVLRDRPLGPVLQYAGDVLAAALVRDRAGAERAARKCLEELDGRGAPGDAELAAELAAALGTARRASDLAEVPVDLGTLGARLGGDGGAHAVDLRRGDVVELDEIDEADADPDGWLTFWPDGTAQPGLADEERRRGRARAWLARHGYRAGPRRL